VEAQNAANLSNALNHRGFDELAAMELRHDD